MNLTLLTDALLRCGAHASALETEHTAIEISLWALNKAGVAGADEDTMALILEALIEHCKQHFVNEEDFIARHKHAGLAQHRMAHQRLLSQLSEARSRMISGDDVAVLDAMDVVSTLREHCQNFDLPCYRDILEDPENFEIGEPRRTHELNSLRRLAYPSTTEIVEPPTTLYEIKGK